MIASERETTITYADADEAVQIYTCIRRDITALKKKLSRGVVLLKEGTHLDGTAYAEFQVPMRLWSVSSGIKRTVSDAEKARRRELALERGFGQKT